MTEEMKRQEQSLNFGETPYSSKSKSVLASNHDIAPPQLLGMGVDALQKQKEFIEFKKQGQ